MLLTSQGLGKPILLYGGEEEAQERELALKENLLGEMFFSLLVQSQPGHPSIT